MIIISLGSNINGEQNIQMAEKRLSEFFSAIRFSRTLLTDPIDMPEGTPQYANALAVIYIDPREQSGVIPLEDLRGMLKMMEKEAGRTDEDKQRGIIALDIDILLYLTQLFKPEDWHRPYNQTLLEELGL